MYNVLCSSKVAGRIVIFYLVKHEGTMRSATDNDGTTNTSPTPTLGIPLEDQEAQGAILAVVMVIVVLVLLIVLVVVGIVILKLKKWKFYLPTSTLEHYPLARYEKGMYACNCIYLLQ